MKKLTFILSVALLLTPSAALAKDFDNHKDNPFQFEMVEEGYTGDAIYRIYLDAKKEENVHYLEIPESFLDRVNNSEQPVLEAKKVLTSIYTNLQLTERLAEVNGEYYDNYGYVKLTMEKELAAVFAKQKQIATSYSEEQLKIYNALSEEEKTNLYDRNQPIYRDHSEIMAELYLSEEELKQINAVFDEEHRALEKELGINEDGESTNTVLSGNKGLIIGIIAIVFALAGVLFFLARRRG